MSVCSLKIVTDKFSNIQHNCMIGYKVTTLALLTGGCSSASKSCNRNALLQLSFRFNNHASVVWHSSPLCHWLHSTRELSLHSHPFLPFLSLAGNESTSSGGAQWMVLQILGQLKPIPNAMVAMIIWRWLEGSLEGTYDWILYFAHAVNMSTMRKQAKSISPGGSVLLSPIVSWRNDRYQSQNCMFGKDNVLSTFTILAKLLPSGAQMSPRLWTI